MPNLWNVSANIPFFPCFFFPVAFQAFASLTPSIMYMQSSRVFGTQRKILFQPTYSYFHKLFIKEMQKTIKLAMKEYAPSRSKALTVSFLRSDLEDAV